MVATVHGGRGQGCCQLSYNVQESPGNKKYPGTNINSGQAERPRSPFTILPRTANYSPWLPCETPNYSPSYGGGFSDIQINGFLLLCLVIGEGTEDLTTESSSFSSEGATYDTDANSYDTLPHVDDMDNDTLLNIRYLSY